uniref:Uncharacterized protein n=1 Tax=Candidatus Kentrum sp. DK TaxID=2126562 RepID=A0A450TNT3_9GAMM|nr:MAG: hypothetical protein BECKDK2373B_GA0170837_12453 [Candidatus Kentron sp. DK]
MFGIRLPIKIFLLLAVFFASACHASEREEVEAFADEVKALISSGDHTGFGKLPVYPGEIVSRDAISYLFGNADDPGLAIFSKGKDIITEIYGPYAREDADGHPVYSIVYYDPGSIAKDKDGHFDPDQIQQHWGTGFVETVVVVVGNRVLFHRTPFYYGSHAPWAGDY